MMTCFVIDNNTNKSTKMSNNIKCYYVIRHFSVDTYSRGQLARPTSSQRDSLLSFPCRSCFNCVSKKKKKKTSVRGAKEASLLGECFLLKREDLSQILVIHIKTEHSHSVPL